MTGTFRQRTRWDVPTLEHHRRTNWGAVLSHITLLLLGFGLGLLW
jgi:hypothetical protein